MRFKKIVDWLNCVMGKELPDLSYLIGEYFTCNDVLQRKEIYNQIKRYPEKHKKSFFWKQSTTNYWVRQLLNARDEYYYNLCLKNLKILVADTWNELSLEQQDEITAALLGKG